MNKHSIVLPQIVLASQSPRRGEILSRHGIAYEVVVPPNVRECSHGADEHLLVLLNAAAKAGAVAALRPDRIVLGADSVILLDGKVYGKPANLEDAYRMLRLFSGRTHKVLTGVALLRKSSAYRRIYLVSTEVRFRPFDEGRVREYLQRTFVLDKAGAYAVQENSELLVAEIHGDFDNIVGLPSEHLKEEILRAERYGA
ncbi:MAG: Maf family protein [Victivallaceae bacterium]|nr:Maf family protein [Victivallaceae bacterium]